MNLALNFSNNSLGTNQRLSNFVPGRAAGCSFCTLKNIGPIPIETVIHLFFDCDSVQPIMNWFEKNIFIRPKSGYSRKTFKILVLRNH